MGKITEFDVLCGLGLNFVIIAVITVIGLLEYSA